MMGKKKLSEIKAELTALLSQVPGGPPQARLQAAIEKAKADPARDVESLEMLCAALEQEVTKGRKQKSSSRPTNG